MNKLEALAKILDPKEILEPTSKSNSALKKILDKRLDELTVSSPSPNTPKILWGPERYGLDQSKIFNGLSEDNKSKYLTRMSELNLALSAFIETSGHNYGAKMILLSETLEEKSTYALFASDEAVHLREFQNFMNFDYNIKTHHHPMLTPLAEVIRDGSKISLVFVIQVLLEGFGMGHYYGLRQTCLYKPLQDSYDQILKDEARHHGTGIILAKEEIPTKEDQEQIFEYTRAFVLAMQSAHWLFETFDFVGESLTKTQTKQLWRELNFEKVLVARLEKLKDMLQKVDSFNLLERLERDGVFKVQGD
tara:strand:- start:1243 stop:2160 length:918 start_codon:yes stop_codon:yes gene_type:complete